MKRLLILTIFLFAGCQPHGKVIRVAATPIPHAELLEVVKPELEKEGITLKVIEIDDYNLPNRLLDEKQVDANFFQHRPFLLEQNKRFGERLQELAAIHIEPLGIYSKTVHSLDHLKEGARLAIPSDPTNEARALNLLAEARLIKLREGKDPYLLTVYDITDNPKRLKIEEIDAPFLTRSLGDVDAAVIPANFALQGNLSPLKDALIIEKIDSPYTNIVVIRAEDEKRPELHKLRTALTSKQVRDYILKKYRGVIIPAF